MARNQFRRRGYAIIAGALPQIKSGFLCAFSARVGIDKLSFTELQNEIFSLLNQVGAFAFKDR